MQIDLAAACEPMEPFGPLYPNLGPSVAKFRRQHAPDAKAYGQAVRAAVRALQRSEIIRVVSTPKPNCASGTAHTEGAKIRAAMRAQQAAALQASVNADRRNRTDDAIRAAYAAAMEAKHGPAPEVMPHQAALEEALADEAPEAVEVTPELAAPPARLRARKMPASVAPGPDSPVIYYSTVKAPGERWSRVGRVIATASGGRDLTHTLGTTGHRRADRHLDGTARGRALAEARLYAETLAANTDLFPAGAHVRHRKEPGLSAWEREERIPECAELSIQDRRALLSRLPAPRSHAAWRRLSHLIRTLKRDMEAVGYTPHRYYIDSTVAAGGFYWNPQTGRVETRDVLSGATPHYYAGLMRQNRTKAPPAVKRGRRGLFGTGAAAAEVPQFRARQVEEARSLYAHSKERGPVPFPDGGKPYRLGGKPRIRVQAVMRPHGAPIVIDSDATEVTLGPANANGAVVPLRPRLKVPLHMLSSASVIAFRARA